MTSSYLQDLPFHSPVYNTLINSMYAGSYVMEHITELGIAGGE